MRTALAGVVVVALVSAAQAQPREVVRTFQAGVDAFRLGKYDEARALLERARALDPDLPGPHRFLAALAQAERRWDDCIASARKALQLKPDSTEVAATRAIHEDCRAGLGRLAFTATYQGGGAIIVVANVEGASVTLGGLRYGATPLGPRALAAGPVDVIVAKQGWRPALTTVDVLPGIVTDVIVTLEPDPAAGAIAAPAGGIDAMTHGWISLGGVGAVDGSTVAVDGEPIDFEPQLALTGGIHEILIEAPGRERWRRRVRVSRGQRTRIEVELPPIGSRARTRRTAWYVLGGAGVAAALGTGAALAWDDADDDGDRGRAETWSYISLGSFGVAAVGAGIGAWLLWKSRVIDVPGRPAPFAIAPILDPGGGLGLGFAMARAL
jgi:hypothetical protein